MGKPLAAMPFVVRFVAGRETSQMRDQFIPVRYAVGANLSGYAGSQDLLGPSRPHLQKGLERFPIHPGERQIAKLTDHLV